jgi:glycerol-3-phosphate acyltransferase PlsY
LEETMAMTFAKSANLRSLLLKNECPSTIKNCHNFFQKLVDSDVRNTLLTDISIFANLTQPSSDSTEDITHDIPFQTSTPTYKALRIHLGRQCPLVKNVKMLRHFTRHGHTFSPFSRHKGNGSVIVYDPMLMSEIPGQVEGIIQLHTNEVYFAIRKYQTFAAQHPFEAFPALQTTLWSSLESVATIVRLDDVIGHFASVPLDWNGGDYIAVVSLCRVILQISFLV